MRSAGLLRSGIVFGGLSAPHPRCDRCTVLMGPGHVEAGLDRFCGTHAVHRTRRVASTADREEGFDVGTWSQGRRWRRWWSRASRLVLAIQSGSPERRDSVH